MIYHIYFQNMGLVGGGHGERFILDYEPKWYEKDILAGCAMAIKESSGDRFIMVTTKNQEPGVMEWINKYEMKEFLEKESEFVRNDNYSTEGPKLKLRIFKSKDVK